MKRHSQSGSSPAYNKFKFLAELDPSTSSDEEFPDTLHLPSQSSHNSYEIPEFIEDPGSPPPSPAHSNHLTSVFDDDHYDAGCLSSASSTSSDESLISTYSKRTPISKLKTDFVASLEEFVKAFGEAAAVETILENTAIREVMTNTILSETHSSLKSSLKKSQLSHSKRDRNYLLTLTPRGLCEELQRNSSSAFLLIVRGLLGISCPDEVFESELLLNTITLVYSTVGKLINRKATGYALLLTTAARDGGLREDTIKLLCCMVTSRTSQRYDKEVMAEGWDTAFKETLKIEKDHFEKQMQADSNIEKLCNEHRSYDVISAARDDLENLLDTAPPQLQMVWDNLNLRTKHRYQRADDDYSASNLDWMASLWIKDRINSNHMENKEGIAVKDVGNLSINDVVASDKEKNYIFRALIRYFAYRLVTRHPMLFKSMVGCIKPNVPHQFQQAMDAKTTEFTGDLFTKSESSTEDLITMMIEVQKNVNVYVDENDVVHCFEKKIVSGDNKTEKNMHHGILSKTDESCEEDSLGFILPSHEYFHQSMVVADCEKELFMDTSRGLEGGAFFAATLLNRKDVKTQRGKDAIDSMKDFILLKSDARFCQYFLKKFDLDPTYDNTPDGLKAAKHDDKEAFVHNLVEKALRDLIPYFRESSSEDPQLVDHPLQEGRRAKYQDERQPTRETTDLEELSVIVPEVVDQTIEQLVATTPDNEEELLEAYMQKLSLNLSGTRSKAMFKCSLCSFETRYRTVCLNHIKTCLPENTDSRPASGSCAEEDETTVNETGENIVKSQEETQLNDMYWNYKNCEFFLDAIFAITDVFERFGDGLGCYIVNKILLPIFHGLRHSNYTNSIHRFITRVLCEATPKEALKLIHEKFSNRSGKPGTNINRDKRMEYRIGTAKKLIANLGPNFSQENVQQVNKTLEVKEELFLRSRKSHGVEIRNELLTFSITSCSDFFFQMVSQNFNSKLGLSCAKLMLTMLFKESSFKNKMEQHLNTKPLDRSPDHTQPVSLAINYLFSS